MRTITDAINGASDGATIALVDGEHVAPFIGVAKDLTIVGRCAEKTKVVPDPGGPGGMRISAQVTARKLTVAGADTAFEVFGAASSLDLEDAVLDGSRGRALFARSGGQANVRRVVVRGTVARSAGDQTIAILAGSGGVVTIEDSAVLDSFDAAIAGADETDTRITVRRTVVDGTTAGAIRAFEGAHVDLVESVIRRAGGVAVLALHRKGGYPEVTLTRSVVIETIPTTATGGELSTAINAAYGAIVNLEETTVADTKGVAIYSAEGAKITATNSAVTRLRNNAQLSGSGATATRGGELTFVSSVIFDSTALGLGAFTGGKVRLERSLVRKIGGAVVDGLGVGFGLNATEASTIDAIDSSLVDATELGAATTDEGTRLTLDKVLIAKTPGAPAGQYGHGILAAYGSIVDVTRSIIDRQNGVALFYAAGGGSVTRSLVRANGIGAHVQEGSTLVEAEAVPEASVAPELVVTTDVRFEENATKTGSGELPLPTVAKEK